MMVARKSSSKSSSKSSGKSGKKTAHKSSTPQSNTPQSNTPKSSTPKPKDVIIDQVAEAVGQDRTAKAKANRHAKAAPKKASKPAKTRTGLEDGSLKTSGASLVFVALVLAVLGLVLSGWSLLLAFNSLNQAPQEAITNRLDALEARETVPFDVPAFDDTHLVRHAELQDLKAENTRLAEDQTQLNLRHEALMRRLIALEEQWTQQWLRESTERTQEPETPPSSETPAAATEAAPAPALEAPEVIESDDAPWWQRLLSSIRISRISPSSGDENDESHEAD